MIETFPAILNGVDEVALVVGDLGRWKTEGRLNLSPDGFTFVEIQDLTPDTFRRTAPDIIFSPLVADGFDALDVAAILKSVGFAGRYRVVAPPLPNAKLISDEVSNFAPELDFDVFQLSEA